MDRATWMREKRKLAEVRMDTLFAHNYDEGWGHINPSHREFMLQFLSLCPPDCTILTASRNRAPDPSSTQDAAKASEAQQAQASRPED